MNKLELGAIKFLKHTSSGEEIQSDILSANVIVMRPGQEALMDIIQNNPELGRDKKILVVDLDDDLWDVNPFTEIYRHTGTKDVDWNGEKLWKDGENGFDIERNKRSLDNTLKMIRNADVVTVTTERLQKRLETRAGVKNVHVVPNAVDLTHWNKLPLKPHDNVRIGWSGGSTHYIDWFSVKDSLPKVVTKGSKLILQGCLWRGTVKDVDYEFHDWIDAEGHPYKVASYGLDMAIIPLEDTDFNKHKSCLKWYEFSSLEVPCVMPNLAPYSDEVEHEKTGFLYNSQEEFIKYANMLKKDKKLREKMGKAARKWIEKNRSQDIVSTDLYNLLYEAYARKTS